MIPWEGTVVAHIDAIILDFGGVFTHPEPIDAELDVYAREVGLAPGALRMALGSGPAWESVSVGAISEEEFWRVVAAPWEEKLPPAFSRFRHGTLLYEPVDDEMVALARALRGRVRLGLLSNATISLSAYLDELGWPAEIFDVIGVSAAIGRRKPDPEAFQWMLEALGTPPARALLVDDKPRNVEAAEALGMQGHIFRSPADLREDLRARGLIG